MFSYVDQSIRERLVGEKRLRALTASGVELHDPDAAEAFVSLLGPIPLPITVAGVERRFAWYPFVRRLELAKVIERGGRVGAGGGTEAFRELIQTHMNVNSLLVYGTFLDTVRPPLVRVHSCCMTGDVFGSMRCECGPQLEAALRAVVAEGVGAVVYMASHEGRGIGLWAKAITYILQDDGQDTYQANVTLGLPEDSRDFSEAAVVLRHFLKGRPIRLLSNNPEKRVQLERHGQPVAAIEPLVTGVGDHNRRYLYAKRDKGHLLPPKL